MRVKGFTERFYRNLCSASLAPVLETLEYIRHETEVWLEITTLIIPGQNDSPGEIEALSRWVLERLGPEVPLHFTAFHPDWKMRDPPPTPRRTLIEAQRIARQVGLRHVYTGNVHDEARQSTYCTRCAARLIGRDWYRITDWALDDAGDCRACGAPCAGVFDGRSGGWGPRRTPLVLGAPSVP